MALRKVASKKKANGHEPARMEYLRIANYRALKSVELKNLTPLTVLLGPNGSGKSTVFDVFNFLSECFQFGLRHAWDRRGRARELRTRGQEGPVVIELKYREQPGTPLITYHLAIDEESGKVFGPPSDRSRASARSLGSSCSPTRQRAATSRPTCSSTRDTRSWPSGSWRTCGTHRKWTWSRSQNGSRRPANVRSLHRSCLVVFFAA